MDSITEDEEKRKEKENLASISLIAFIIPLILYEIFAIIICIVLCACKKNFADQSNYSFALYLAGASFLFSPFIGCFLFIAVIVMTLIDARKVKKPDETANGGETEMQNSEVITVSAVQDSKPTEKDNGYPSASDQYGQQNKEENPYAAEQPYTQPNSYGYQF